jgi:hypothetical protein
MVYPGARAVGALILHTFTAVTRFPEVCTQDSALIAGRKKQKGFGGKPEAFWVIWSEG